MGLLGAGAKGSKKAVKGLLDDERLARGEAKGYTTELYHGTYGDISEVDQEMVDLGLHMGTPQQAVNRLHDTFDPVTGTGARFKDDVYREGANIIPLKVRLGNVLEMADVGDWKNSYQVLSELRHHPKLSKHSEQFEDMMQYADEHMGSYPAYPEQDQIGWNDSTENRELLNEIKDILSDEGYDSIKYLNQVENTYGSYAGLTPVAKAKINAISSRINEIEKAAHSRLQEPPLPDDPDLDKKMKIFLSQDRNAMLTPSEARELDSLRSESMRISDDPKSQADPNSYISLNPDKDVRARSAQFKERNGGLLASTLLPTTGSGLLAMYALSPDDARAAQIAATDTRDIGSIQAARNPRLQRAAGLLGSIDTPIGSLFESTPNVLNRWAYGEEADTMDKLGMALELMP